MTYTLNKRKTGGAYEKRAAELLISNGLTIIEHNFRCKLGEIDIICKDGDTYVFIEVKYRRTNVAGNPYEAVNYNKQRKICNVATYYKMIKKLPDNGSFRFDVISILGSDITWYKNAFMYVR